MPLDGRKIYDISPLISSRTSVFPGDTPFKEKFLMEFNKGDHLSLSSIETTVHLGAHADAPSHYHPYGDGIHERSLHYYFGMTQVIEVDLKKNHRIKPEDFFDEIQAPRVLFKTNSFPNPELWNSDFMSLSKNLVEFLAEKKVLLVGIDTPSIDLAEDKILESHLAIYKHDMAILEGLVLSDVKPGIYDLISLPLKIEGAEASPVRAILLEREN